jgi:hypothetical protein
MKRTVKIMSVWSLIFICVFIFSCSWAVGYKDSTLITKNGIVGLIEIDRTIGELSRKKLSYKKKPSPFRRPKQVIYAVEDLGFEFETHNDIVVRIWFFADKNEEFKIKMPKDGVEKALCKIVGKEIVKNFGPVKKYVNQNPPKDKKKAVWAKCQPFGIMTNTINYPDSPFHFGLNWDDTLSYITVSKLKGQ